MTVQELIDCLGEEADSLDDEVRLATACGEMVILSIYPDIDTLWIDVDED